MPNARKAIFIFKDESQKPAQVSEQCALFTIDTLTENELIFVHFHHDGNVISNNQTLRKHQSLPAKMYNKMLRNKYSKADGVSQT